MSVDKKVKDYLARARKITADFLNTDEVDIKSGIEIAKMIQIEEILNSKIVKNIQKFTGL